MILILRDMGLLGRYTYPLSLLPVQRERRGNLPVSYDLDPWEFRQGLKENMIYCELLTQMREKGGVLGSASIESNDLPSSFLSRRNNC
jgi:hypothetical protein